MTPRCYCEQCAPVGEVRKTYTQAHIRQCEIVYLSKQSEKSRRDYFRGVERFRGEDARKALERDVNYFMRTRGRGNGLSDAAQSLDDLIALGQKRGYRNPHAWANYVFKSRADKSGVVIDA